MLLSLYPSPSHRKQILLAFCRFFCYMTPLVLPFQPLYRHVRAIMMPSYLQPAGMKKMLLPCRLFFCYPNLILLLCICPSILPRPFIPAAFSPSFNLHRCIYHFIPIFSFMFPPSDLLPLDFPFFMLLPSFPLPAFLPQSGQPAFAPQ